MYLIGGLGYIYVRATDYARSITGRFEMRVILRDGTPADQISATANTIRQIDGVKEVFWIPKEKAWDLDKAKYPVLTVRRGESLSRRVESHPPRCQKQRIDPEKIH